MSFTIKNLKNILKIFTLNEFDNLCLFVDKIQDNKKSKNDFKLEDFYDLILNITNIHH